MQILSRPWVLRYLTQLPLYLVWFAGVALAVTRWRRHPRVSLLTVIGLALFFLSTFGGTFVNAELPLWVSRRDLGVRTMGLVLTLTAVAQFLVWAVAWGLILAAIFGWRDDASGGYGDSQSQTF